VWVTVAADHYNDVEECDEENNILQNEFHCPAPDLVITYKYETVNPEDCTFTVTYTIHNNGNCIAGPSDTTIWIDGVAFLEDPVPPLAPCETYTNEVGPFDCPPCQIVTIGVEADNYDDVEECNEENNLLENEFHCPAPDLEIIEKFETVNHEDCTFTVTFVVANFGFCMAGESVACVYIDGVHQDADVDVGPLAADECTDPIEVGPFDCPLGEDIEVEVCADNYDAVEECDEENNCMTNILPCPGVPLPDLVITNCEPVGNRIHYTIANIGTADAPRSITGLWIDDIYRASEMDDPLEPGDELPGVFARYNYRGGDIRVCADYQNRIEEANEGNNCREEGPT
jgi:subtilase family serine protease